MALRRIVRIDSGDIAAGGFKDLDYAPEVNLRLKRIIAVETTAAAYRLVFVRINMGDIPLTAPDISAELLRPDLAQPIIFDLVHVAGVKLIFRITNADTTTRRVHLHLVYEE
jgi:hypothetical protein